MSRSRGECAQLCAAAKLQQSKSTADNCLHRGGATLPHCGGNCPAKQMRPRRKCRKAAKRRSKRLDFMRRYRIELPHANSCCCGECGKCTHRQLWHEKNRNIIQALAKATNWCESDMSEFLYTLSMQNFAKLLQPRRAAANTCNDVPLCNFDSCDHYMGIFDCQGNLRNPYYPESLLKLLRMMQSMLPPQQQQQQQKQQQSLPQRQRRRRAERAGIAAARLNGLRRRFGLQQKHELNASSLRFGQSLGPKAANCGSYNACNMSPNYDPYGLGLAGNIFGAGGSVWAGKAAPTAPPHDVDAAELNRLIHALAAERGKLQPASPVFDATAQSKQLLQLIEAVKRKIGLNKDIGALLAALRQLNLPQDGTELLANRLELYQRLNGRLPDLDAEADAQSVDGGVGGVGMPQYLQHYLQQQHNLRQADYYNRLLSNALNYERYGNDKALDAAAATAAAAEFEQLRQAASSIGSQSSAASFAAAQPNFERNRPARRPSKYPAQNHYFYAAAVPVLVHKPFDPKQSSTWLRRHPDAARVNDLGEIIATDNIKRYRRNSVERELTKARQLFSVSSSYYGETPQPPMRPKFQSNRFRQATR